MSIIHTFSASTSLSPLCSVYFEPYLLRISSISPQNPSSYPTLCTRCHWDNFLPSPVNSGRILKPLSCFAVAKKSGSEPYPDSNSKPKAKPKSRTRQSKAEDSQKHDENLGRISRIIKHRKPRRGRRSEAVAVEDFVRNSLEKTLASIQQKDHDKEEKNIVYDRIDSKTSDDDDEDEEEDESENGDVAREEGKRKKIVVEEENPNWPLDAEVGWGIRASEYFEKYPIKNVVVEDGFEIDWEGEIEDNWVKEIDCLEWERFAFHPSPLIVLVFERYNRATDNWKTLKELEKAVKVYWSAKDRLPPRSVKIDINIERDLAYALKVRECPQILFLRGSRILYREKEFRTADELVQMIAHFYYKAKKPSCINDAALQMPGKLNMNQWKVDCDVGESYQCVISWKCQDNQACEVECRNNYAGGRGFCTGNPKTCLCAYGRPP